MSCVRGIRTRNFKYKVIQSEVYIVRGMHLKRYAWGVMTCWWFLWKSKKKMIIKRGKQEHDQSSKLWSMCVCLCVRKSFLMTFYYSLCLHIRDTEVTLHIFFCLLLFALAERWGVMRKFLVCVTIIADLTHVLDKKEALMSKTVKTHHFWWWRRRTFRMCLFPQKRTLYH